MVKKKELEKAIEVLEKEEVSKELIEMLKGIAKNKATDEVNLINRCDYFAKILWQEEDIYCALEKNNIKPTKENISAVANESVGVLEDCSHGWDVLDVVISDLFKNNK